MALSSLSFPSRGSGPYPLHGLDYLSTAHLQARVNGTPVSATFDDATKTMTLAAAPAAGATVSVHRTTPRLREQRLTQYLSLPSGQGGLTGTLLDQDYRQGMLIAGEARDIADALPEHPDAMFPNAGDQWDGEGLKVADIVAGVEANDAVTKAQLDATIAATPINLPTAVLDADDGLMVAAGVWDDVAPAAFRTGLGLGGIALLNQGTGANQVPAFDGATNPPSYPTADGRNIDLTNHAIQAEILKRSLATVVRWSQQANASPGVNPNSPTWSQSSSTRLNLSGGWGGRVELNNGGGAVDGSAISPYRIRLSAGTWRIRWMFKPRMPLAGSATNRTSLRLTNSDDTSSQIVYYDLGLHRPSVDFADQDYSIFPDSIILTFGSASDVVFRYTNFASGGNNDCNFSVLFQLIKA